MIRLYGWVLVRVVPFMAPVVVENKAGRLPLPVIFVANHCSAVDPFLFGMLNVENAFVTTWPFKIPVYGIMMRMACYIDARAGWQDILQQGSRLLDSNCSLIIWPEGHRSLTGAIGRFRKGAFQLAVLAGRPIIPVCIKGSGQVLPPGKRLFNPGRIKMVLLPPVYPENSNDLGGDIEALMAKARQSIEDELTGRGII
ncbi:MAG: 1-acyl-sn-glycerol-3-phosphate acyltransferase [Desulfobulbaceae bacterium]|nr:1-acyl-sn-glycerol-3-phosphate acyltransferase [Desulfobulbaceae bacterium]